MGVLQRFERRLEGMVEGAFAKVFGGVVQPVEVAAALQREAGQNKQIMGPGRVLVPNVYVVELSQTDLERFAEWDEQLRSELAAMVAEHAADQGWSFVDDVRVNFEQVDELDTGMFRVRSNVLASVKMPASSPPRGVSALSGRATSSRIGADRPSDVRPLDRGTTDNPRLVLAATADEPERTVPLTRPVLVIGRGTESDLRLPDTGVSRRHAEVRLDGAAVRLSDLGSTNGTRVNGRRIETTTLEDEDRIEIGATRLTYRSRV